MDKRHLMKQQRSNQRDIPFLATSIISISKEEHLSYGIMVQYGQLRWVVYKRYSEFRQLRETLLALLGATQCSCRGLYLSLPSMAFPRRKLKIFSKSADDIALERRQSLHQFLAVTVTLLRESLDECDNGLCPVLPLLKTFLQVQRHTQLPNSTSPHCRSRAIDPEIYTIREGGENIDCSPRYCVASR